jgi:hypothetical protein
VPLNPGRAGAAFSGGASDCLAFPFDTDTGILIAATHQAGDVSALATQAIPGGPGCQLGKQAGIFAQCDGVHPGVSESFSPHSSLILRFLTKSQPQMPKGAELAA